MSRFLDRVAVGGGQPKRALALFSSPATPAVGSAAPIALSVFGGTAPYVITLLTGSLPTGRSLSGQTLVGTYTTPASYSYVLRVTDADGARADLALTETVAAFGGLSATNVSGGVDYQYHVNTAAMTFLGGNVSFVGSVIGTVLTVTSGTGPTVGMIVSGATVQKYRRVLTNNGDGTYNLAGDPVTPVPAGTALTASGDKVVLSVAERNGGPPLTGSPTTAFILETDDAGCKYLVQGQTTIPSCSFMDCAAPSMDNGNVAWFAAWRYTGSHGGCLVSHSTTNNHPVMQVDTGNHPLPFGSAGAVPPTSPNRARMFACANLHVMGISSGTPVGQGAIDRQRYYLNETVDAYTSTYGGQFVDTGFRVGAPGGRDFGLLNSHLYELVCKRTTAANYVAIGDSIQAAMTANWKTVPFVDSVITAGDSRGEGSTAASTNFAEMFSRRSTGLPATTRVINVAYSGGTENTLAESFFRSPGVCDVGAKLPGKNTIAWFSGANDCINTDPIWPSINTAQYTTARGDEVYNGTGLTTSFVGSYDCNNGALTVTSGTFRRGAIFEGGVPTGAFVLQAMNVGTTLNGPGSYSYFTQIGPIGQTRPAGTALTCVWGNRVTNVAVLLARGFYVGVGVELGLASSVAQERLRYHLRNDLLTDAQAGPGQTYAGKLKIVDHTKIQVAGRFVFGEDILDSDELMRDKGLHGSDKGYEVLFAGGDTPQLGFRALVA